MSRRKARSTAMAAERSLSRLSSKQVEEGVFIPSVWDTV